ncbi:hypothetical protein KR222_004883, partial [Zaprionus bogoriensis]
ETEPQLDNHLNGDDGSPTDTEATISKLPSEVQRAVCTVNAGDVKASAEAVTTKTLKGVCGSGEMNLAFRHLEEKLFGELREIKELLSKLSGVREHQESNSIPQVPSVDKIPILKPTALKRFKFEQITLRPSLELKTIKQARLKPIEPEREDEVDRFNNTMLADSELKLFTYYWKLENITEHIANTSSTTVKSPVFSIKGKTVQLSCTFQHLHREMIYLQLTLAYPNDHEGGRENKIMLDMGGQLKQLKWAENVPFKHKISILDRSQRRSQDLSSQELTKLDMGFPIPNSAITGSNFVRHNSLLIQVILYL